VDPSKCTGCGTCVRLCHRHAPYLMKNVWPEKHH
ncbi:MAG TPA: 4Fe-4S ferredoxin, partial [Lachnospiraceae bacterium]|nr:4Fe-4S ferredoxin [Lachnospiraceae bacterium]